MNIGEVRTARKGEIPNGYALDDIKEGDAVVFKGRLHGYQEEGIREALSPHGPVYAELRKSHPAAIAYELSLVMQNGGTTPFRREYLEHKRRVRFWWVVGLIVLAGVLVWAALAHADAPPAPAPSPAPCIHLCADRLPQEVHATVTAYTSSKDETDNTPFITASGAHTGPGVLACPAKYAFGTQIKIGDATYTCRDRMNARFAEVEHFDVWVYTKTEARSWGHKTLDISIVGVE